MGGGAARGPNWVKSRWRPKFKRKWQKSKKLIFLSKTMLDEVVFTKKLELLWYWGSKRLTLALLILANFWSWHANFQKLIASKLLMLERWELAHSKGFFQEIIKQLRLFKICVEIVMQHSLKVPIKCIFLKCWKTNLWMQSRVGDPCFYLSKTSLTTRTVYIYHDIEICQVLWPLDG